MNCDRRSQESSGCVLSNGDTVPCGTALSKCAAADAAALERPHGSGRREWRPPGEVGARNLPNAVLMISARITKRSRPRHFPVAMSEKGRQLTSPLISVVSFGSSADLKATGHHVRSALNSGGRLLTMERPLLKSPQPAPTSWQAFGKPSGSTAKICRASSKTSLVACSIIR